MKRLYTKEKKFVQTNHTLFYEGKSLRLHTFMCSLSGTYTGALKVKKLYCPTPQNCTRLSWKWSSCCPSKIDPYLLFVHLCSAFLVNTFSLCYISNSKWRTHRLVLSSPMKNMLRWTALAETLDLGPRKDARKAWCSAQCALPAPSSANIQRPQEDPSRESPNEALLLSTQDSPRGPRHHFPHRGATLNKHHTLAASNNKRQWVFFLHDWSGWCREGFPDIQQLREGDGK